MPYSDWQYSWCYALDDMQKKNLTSNASAFKEVHLELIIWTGCVQSESLLHVSGIMCIISVQNISNVGHNLSKLKPTNQHCTYINFGDTSSCIDLIMTM